MQKNKNKELSMKIFLLGESGAWKSIIISCYISDIIEEESKETNGPTFKQLKLKKNLFY